MSNKTKKTSNKDKTLEAQANAEAKRLEVQAEADKKFLECIEDMGVIDADIEIMTDRNGTLDQSIYAFMQLFNTDRYNGKTVAQWSVNYENDCNRMGIKCKQKNVKDKTADGVIKSELTELSSNVSSRVSKIKRFQATTVTKAQEDRGLEPIGKTITSAVKWYDIQQAVKPAVDEEFNEVLKALKKHSHADIVLALEFLENKVELAKFSIFAQTIKDTFESVDDKASNE